MSRFVRKSHNVNVLMYHLVFVAKYRRVVIDAQVDAVLREVCLELALRYEVEFLEIGTDGDHVHFLVQSVPTYSPTKIVMLLKSVLAREVFRRARCFGARGVSALSPRQEAVVERRVLVGRLLCGFGWTAGK